MTAEECVTLKKWAADRNPIVSTCMGTPKQKTTGITNWPEFEILNGVLTLTGIDASVLANSGVATYGKNLAFGAQALGCSSCVRSGLEWWTK